MCKSAAQTTEGFFKDESTSKETSSNGSLPELTRDEIATSRSDLVIIEDLVYSAERFRWAHPGGALFVSMFGGRDGTLAFQSYHMREFPHDKMRDYLVGRLDASETPQQMDRDHLRLSKLVKSHLSKSSSSSSSSKKKKSSKETTFAPTSQRVKALVLFGLAVLVEAYPYVYHTQRTFVQSFVLGFLFALIGLNIQHDANHGAMFKTGRWNAVCGLAQSWIGGSQIMWLQEHVVLHHLHTGDRDMDPDAQLAPVMRGYDSAPYYPWMAFQKYYLVLLELGYGAVPLFMALGELAAWRHKFEFKYRVSQLAWWPWGLISLLGHLVFYVRFFVLPFLVAFDVDEPKVVTLCKTLTTVVAGGGYLAFFFFLSHNFDGVKFVDGAKPDGSATYPDKSGFLVQQVNASSNVAGSNLCALNGGLNYQIEHHLFPRIAHSHYPTIAPLVRRFVKDTYDVSVCQYVHFDSVAHNLAAVFSYLDKTGKRPPSGPRSSSSSAAAASFKKLQ